MEYIIYHQVKPGVDCPDGIMAAAIAVQHAIDHDQPYTLLGDCYKHNDDYGDRPHGLPDFKEGDRLTIVDFSYPAAWLNHWESEGIQVTVIDHHAPKFPMLEGFSGAVLDANECGATLAWKHFYGDRPMPEILTHVRRRDIGADGYYKADENCRDSKAITEAIAHHRHEADNSIDLCRDWLGLRPCSGGANLPLLQRQGDELLIEADRIINAAADRAEAANLRGHVCGRVVLEKDEDRHGSMIGNRIALKHPEWEFAWFVCSDGSNGLRSSNGFDVSEIAAQMGGGGHKTAAGWTESKKE